MAKETEMAALRSWGWEELDLGNWRRGLGGCVLSGCFAERP